MYDVSQLIKRIYYEETMFKKWAKDYRDAMKNNGIDKAAYCLRKCGEIEIILRTLREVQGEVK